MLFFRLACYMYMADQKRSKPLNSYFLALEKINSNSVGMISFTKLVIAKILVHFITPSGIRIRVFSVKGRCPRPLDDGGFYFIFYI